MSRLSAAPGLEAIAAEAGERLRRALAPARSGRLRWTPAPSRPAGRRRPRGGTALPRRPPAQGNRRHLLPGERQGRRWPWWGNPVRGRASSPWAPWTCCPPGRKPLPAAPPSWARVLQDLEAADWRQLVGMGIGVLFQDAIGSWDPIEMIGPQSGEVLEAHEALGVEEVRRRVLDALGQVRLPRRLKYASYAHEMSRGQAQRAMLAAALLSMPRMLIADEPLSGLDVTVARAVLGLIDDMRAGAGHGPAAGDPRPGGGGRSGRPGGGGLRGHGGGRGSGRGPVPIPAASLHRRLARRRCRRWPGAGCVPSPASRPSCGSCPPAARSPPAAPTGAPPAGPSVPGRQPVGESQVACLRAGELALPGIGA